MIKGIAAALVALVLMLAGARTAHAADTLMVNLSVYDTAAVRANNGVVNVGAVAAYGVNAGPLPVGSTMTVTLPAGFTFTSSPSLTVAGSSFVLTSGGVGAQSAVFNVAGAAIPVGATISLNPFQMNSGVQLESVVLVANAFPIALQASANDLAPLTAPAFAASPSTVVGPTLLGGTDCGAQPCSALFVGAIQFADPASGDTMFAVGPSMGPPDTATVVITEETFCFKQSGAANCFTANALNASGVPVTGIEVIYGNFQNIAAAFTSTTSDCLNPLSTGQVYPDHLALPNIPQSVDIFTCITANGTGRLPANPNGFSAMIFPSTATDFIAANYLVEFPGIFVCSDNLCTPASVPTLSGSAEMALLACLGLLGAGLVARRRQTPAVAWPR